MTRTIITIPLAFLPVQDQGGEQHAFCDEQNKVNWSRLIIPIMSFSAGRVITFLAHTRGRVTVFSAENWGRAYKNCTWQKKLHQPSPPPLINDRSLNSNVIVNKSKFLYIPPYYFQIKIELISFVSWNFNDYSLNESIYAAMNHKVLNWYKCGDWAKINVFYNGLIGWGSAWGHATSLSFFFKTATSFYAKLKRL